MIHFNSRKEAYAFIVELHVKEGYACLCNPSLKHVEKIEQNDYRLDFILLNSEGTYSFEFSSDEVAADLANAYQYLLLEV